MKRVLSIIALMFGIVSIPSFFGWILLSIGSLSSHWSSFHSINDLIYGIASVLYFVAGWLGWISLAWLAVNFKSLGLITFPHWVNIGLFAGIANVESFWIIVGIFSPPINSINFVILFLLFGGAPFSFTITTLIKHAIIQRNHYFD